ncbi:MAG: hypothetical protein AAGA87_17230 [Pseudomonadota bacterium]
MYDFDTGAYSRAVTGSAEAGVWFDRGLAWTYAYAHEEAVRCFQAALDADPGCALAAWGVGYATGPNYNMPWDLHDDAMRAEALAAAYDAVQAGLACDVGDVERALLEALAERFPQRDLTALDVMQGWNAVFADRMREVHRAYPDDLDVRTVFVEAIMNLTPWAMWDQATGAPAEGAGTVEAQAVIEDALEADPEAWRHPGLLHLYVHLMEMSPTPEKALKAGSALRELVPDAGHLLHMPTHLEVQCGGYEDTVYWNERAMAADRKFLAKHGVFNIYTGYRIHNNHFAAYGAMFLGQYERAMAAARSMVEETPEELLRVESPPMADYFESYIAVSEHVMVRFGRWREIIALPLPEDPVLYANLTAIRLYAKGVAHAALGEVAEAEQRQAEFREAVLRVPETRLMHTVTCQEQLAVAEEMLEGEILYRKADYEGAFRHLRAAVELEDALPYDEPWGWMQPVRHALGALLLEQGEVAEAEAVYRADLGLGGQLPRAQVHPDNVWALRGLMGCLSARGAGDSDEGRLVAQRLALAEARADGPVGVSCFCAQG